MGIGVDRVNGISCLSMSAACVTVQIQVLVLSGSVYRVINRVLNL